MLKNRSFLFGLGTGIILGALLFQLMLFGEQNKEKLLSADPQFNEKLYTQSEVDALVKAELDSAGINEKRTQDSTADTNISQEEEIAEKEADLAEDANQPVSHLIQIKAGTSISQAAELLADRSIISNPALFTAKMKEEDKLVRAGYFLLAEGMSEGDAINMITSQPLTKKEADAIQSQQNVNE